jgi:hypothetical protein
MSAVNHPHRFQPIRHFVLLLLALFTACSQDGQAPPTRPVALGETPFSQPLGAREELSFAELLEASDHEDYSLISGSFGGGGGSLIGTVAGYSDTCKLVVPAGSYQGLNPLSLLVPRSGVAVYQLLPHGQTFNSAVTVTFDYSKWLAAGDFAHGDSCEVLYMDEVNEEFDALSPRALFVADSLAPTVSFQTLHFSRWLIGNKP